MMKFGQIVCSSACLLALMAGAEDKFVFAIRYFQSDRDVAEVSNVVVRAAKAGYTGLALVSGRDYTGNWWDAGRPDDRTPAFRAAHAALDSWWVMSPDRQRRVKEVARICAANGLELVPFMWSVGYNSMRYAEPEVAASVSCEAREVEPLAEPLHLDGEFGGTSESRSLATTASVESNGLYEIRGEVKTEHLHWSEFGGFGCGARCIVSDPEDNGDQLAFVSAKGKATRGWTPFSLTFASGRQRLVKVEVGRWWDNSGSCAFRNLMLQQMSCDDWVTRDGETMTRKWFADRQSSACMSDARLYAYFKRSAAAVRKEFAPKKWFLSMDEIRVDCECAACRKTPFSERLGKCLRAQYEAIKAVEPDATIYVWSDMIDPGHNCRSGDPLAALPNDTVIAIWDARRTAESITYFTGRGYRVLGAAYYDLQDAKSVSENYASWKRLLDASGKSTGLMYTTWAGFRGCTEGDYRFLEDFR